MNNNKKFEEGDWCKFWDDDLIYTIGRFRNNDKTEIYPFETEAGELYSYCERLSDELQELLNKDL